MQLIFNSPESANQGQFNSNTAHEIVYANKIMEKFKFS